MAPSSATASGEFHLFSPLGIAVSFGLFLSFVTLYVIGTGIYNLYFHPISHIPGPLLARASGIPYTLRLRSGNIIPWIQELHAKYGDAVRVAPNDISFISGETAWQDVYGFRIGKHKTGAYLKDRTWFAQPVNGTYSLIAADEEAHSRMRRNLSHSFSDKALREQESLVQKYIDLFVHQLKDEVQNSRNTIDIMRWYNYATFDIIADLTFGEPLYCLRDKGYHPWVTMVFKAVSASSALSTRVKYPMFDYWDRLRGIFTDKTAVHKARTEFFDLATSKVTNRLDREADRPDFMSFIIKNQATAEKALSRSEIDANAVLFLIAGSETTATTLSGATYLLLTNPKAYSKLVHEIRSRFTAQNQITIEEVNKLEYLMACIQEGLRYYPPVPTGFPRVVPPGGGNISGQYIPEGTSVYVSQHAMNHSSRNYTDPDAYVPERWLGDERYKNDKQEALQPFSFGPRNCLGKNLAYAELRLIMAKLLFNFDLELVDKSKDWMKGQKVFTLWAKPSLEVRLHPVE